MSGRLMNHFSVLNRLVFASILSLISSCSSESPTLGVTQKKTTKPSVTAGSSQTLTEYSEVILTATILDPDNQIETLDWEQLTGTEVELISNDIQVSFSIPTITQDELAKFRVTLTTINNEKIEDDVEVVFLDSEPLATHNLQYNNVVTSDTATRIKLDIPIDSTEIKWVIASSNGASAVINDSSENSIDVLSKTIGDFQVKVLANNSYREEVSLINFQVVEPWIADLIDSTNTIQPFIESDGDYIFALDPNIPEDFEVQWFHNENFISDEAAINLTLTELGKNKISLVVHNQGSEIYSYDWNIDIFKRQVISKELINSDSGNITISEKSDSTLAGLALNIPENSPHSTNEINLAINHQGDSSYAFSLTPHGAEFIDPVSISLPTPHYINSDDSVFIRHTDNEMKYGRMIKGNVLDGKVTFSTDHFSNFEVVTGKGSLSEVDELSNHNQIYSEDLTQSYLLFNKIYSDINKAHLAIDAGSNLVTTATLTLHINKAKDNAELLKASLSNHRLTEVINNLQRPNSYWVERGMKGNYGSIQHAATIKKAEDLVKVLKSFQTVLGGLSSDLKISDLNSTQIGEIRSATNKVGKVIQPLFIGIDLSFAIWEANNGDYWASSKSFVNAFSGGLQIFLGSAIVTQGKLTLANGAKPAHLIGALVATHVLQSFVLEPYIYEPSSNFINFILEKAQPELSRLDDAAWGEFKAKMKQIKSGEGDKSIEDFTDLKGIYAEFKKTTIAHYNLANEIRREALKNYDEVFHKNKNVNLAYINFETMFSNSLDITNWQLERIQREINKAASLVEQVTLVREEVINSIIENSLTPFSFDSIQSNLVDNNLQVKWSMTGIAHVIKIQLEVDNNSFTLSNIKPQESSMIHDTDIQNIGQKYGKSSFYTIKLIAEDTDGITIGEASTLVKLPDDFWRSQNRKPEFINSDPTHIRINDLIKGSLTSEEPSNTFQYFDFELNIIKELEFLRVIDRDNDLLAFSPLSFFDTNEVSKYLDNGIYYSPSKCTISNAQDVNSYDDSSCKGDTKGHNTTLFFNYSNDANSGPRHTRMCQGENPFSFVKGGECNNCGETTTSLGAFSDSSWQDWRLDKNGVPEKISETVFDASFSYSIKNDMPVKISKGGLLPSGEGVKTVNEYGQYSLFFENELLDAEEYGNGEFYIITITLSSCNGYGVGKKVSNLNDNVDFMATINWPISIKDAKKDGVEIIKIIAQKKNDNLEIIGYSSTDVSGSTISDYF